MTKIPYARQSISEEDISAVVEILKSDWLTTGPAVEKFEKDVATYCGAQYAVAVNSATSALHVACLAAGLSEGDILWTTPNTFVASANCGLYCGAKVDFVEINEKTYNMSVEALEEKLIKAGKEGKLPKVVIPVDFAGQSCEMERISELAKKYGFIVIEDASHAIGGKYKDQKVGSCYYADMVIFSFHPVKIITTGEGGMVVTNNKDFANKLSLLRSHAITRDDTQMQGQSEGDWYYQQIRLGFNYRITDIQAALGSSQLKKIDTFVEKRHKIAKKYFNELKSLPIILPFQNPNTYSAWHLFVIQIEEKSGKTRKEVFDYLRGKGILVNVHYIPVHTQPYYQQQGFHWGDFPKAEQYYKRAISLPMYTSLTEAEQNYIIETLKKYIYAL